MLLRSPSLWATLTFSDGCLMLLKSPKIHQSPIGTRFLSCLMESHKIRLQAAPHGAYTFTMNIFYISWVHVPSNRMYPLPETLLSTLKICSFHTHSSPPIVLIAGWDSQLISLSPHKDMHIALSICSFFVSCMHNKSTWCFCTNLLIVVHCTPLPNPLTL